MVKKNKDTSPQIVDEVIKNKITIENYHKFFRLKHQEIWKNHKESYQKILLIGLKSEFANSQK